MLRELKQGEVAVIEKPSAQVPIGDLSDFIIRWSSFRPLALYVRDRRRFSEEERLVIGWLIELADRVGPLDLQIEADSAAEGARGTRISGACVSHSTTRRV